MSCFRYCCPCYFKDDYDEVDKDKPPEKPYDLEAASREVVLPEFEKVPLDKVFEFKQPAVPMQIHPQISEHTVIAQQPMVEHGSACFSQVSHSESVSTISSETQAVVPLLHFSLYYDIQRRTLTVHLMKGTNLPAKDRHGTSDPFVIIFLLPNKEQIFQTKVHQKELNPDFNEVFEFSGLLPAEIRRQSLVFRILDKDTLSSSDDIGSVILPLEEADLYGVKVSAKISEIPATVLQSNSKGDLLLSLMYNPGLNLLAGIVLKATNLQRMDISGSADPYIKIHLMYKEERKGKWKSSIKRKTLVPIYNEQFQFDLTDMEMKYVRLDIYVMDYDMLSRNDVMGVLQLGEDIPAMNSPSGQQHWREMLNNPRTPISRWHAIESQNRLSLRRGVKAPSIGSLEEQFAQ